MILYISFMGRERTINMQTKLQIKPSQLLCSIILVEFGSALLLDVARNAGKDGWITLLIGTVIGIIIYSIYVKLFHYYPDLPLTSYIQKIWGPYVGWIVSLLYVVYFIYIAGRILRDFAELLIITAYTNTSILTIGLLMIVSISYAVMKGLNGLARISSICLVTVLTAIILIVLGEALSGLFQFHRTLPVLENGWRPVFETLFPTVTTAPFGELIVFTMLLPFLSKKEKAFKFGAVAIIISGVYLAFSSILHLIVLGESIAVRSTFPILSAASMINIADFISRINALIVFAMVILGFFKISIFFYCAVLGASHLFKVSEKKLFILPIGILILYSSIISAWSFNEHAYEGFLVVPYYLHLPFQIIIPLLLLITIIIKNRLKEL